MRRIALKAPSLVAFVAGKSAGQLHLIQQNYFLHYLPF